MVRRAHHERTFAFPLTLSLSKGGADTKSNLLPAVMVRQAHHERVSSLTTNGYLPHHERWITQYLLTSVLGRTFIEEGLSPFLLVLRAEAHSEVIRLTLDSH